MQRETCLSGGEDGGCSRKHQQQQQLQATAPTALCNCSVLEAVQQTAPPHCSSRIWRDKSSCWPQRWHSPHPLLLGPLHACRVLSTSSLLEALLGSLSVSGVLTSGRQATHRHQLTAWVSSTCRGMQRRQHTYALFGRSCCAVDGLQICYVPAWRRNLRQCDYIAVAALLLPLSLLLQCHTVVQGGRSTGGLVTAARVRLAAIGQPMLPTLHALCARGVSQRLHAAAPRLQTAGVSSALATALLLLVSVLHVVAAPSNYPGTNFWRCSCHCCHRCSSATCMSCSAHMSARLSAEHRPVHMQDLHRQQHITWRNARQWTVPALLSGVPHVHSSSQWHRVLPGCVWLFVCAPACLLSMCLSLPEGAARLSPPALLCCFRVSANLPSQIHRGLSTARRLQNRVQITRPATVLWAGIQAGQARRLVHGVSHRHAVAVGARHHRSRRQWCADIWRHQQQLHSASCCRVPSGCHGYNRVVAANHFLHGPDRLSVHDRHQLQVHKTGARRWNREHLPGGEFQRQHQCDAPG